jgi:hypothetical protein
MGNSLLSNNPFAILTFIAAPAILTNASSVLAMSTINRMLRARDIMRDMVKESESKTTRDENFIAQVNRQESQAIFLIRAMSWIYTALGAFVAATLVTLVGAVAGQLGSELALRTIIGLGLVLGFIGVMGLIGGCLNLFHATQLSLLGIRNEAATIRARQNQKNTEINQRAS